MTMHLWKLIAFVSITFSTCTSFVLYPTSNSQKLFNCISQELQRPSNKCDTLLFSSSSSNPLEDESEEERQKRMELVHLLQKSFYQDEESTKAPVKGSTIMEDVPLYRTQWTELPGFQSVLNVDVPNYTNMFQKILHSSNEVKYFGHLYLPNGEEDGVNPLDKPENTLEDGTTGVLMKITAHQELENGNLVLVVQALEKFRIVHVKRQYSPYSIATIEITPDQELVHAQRDLENDDSSHDSIILDDDDSASSAAAVAEAFEWHGFEFEPVIQCDNTAPTMKVDYASIGVDVLPLVSYNLKSSISLSSSSSPSSKVASSIAENVDQSILDYEHRVWVLIDEMIHLLQTFVDPKKEKPVPIPTQILSLLPTSPVLPWPESFSLEEYAIKLENEGTPDQKEFMRVNKCHPNYSPIRRAQRLSYIIWALTDTIVLPDNSNFDCSRQRILEVDSVRKRLDVGMKKLQLICLMIRNVLSQHDNRSS